MWQLSQTDPEICGQSHNGHTVASIDLVMPLVPSGVTGHIISELQNTDAILDCKSWTKEYDNEYVASNGQSYLQKGGFHTWTDEWHLCR